MATDRKSLLGAQTVALRDDCVTIEAWSQIGSEFLARYRID